MKTEISNKTRITPEEELLSHLEYIMTCSSEERPSECIFEIGLLFQTANNSVSLNQMQKRRITHYVILIRFLLKPERRKLIKANRLLWKLHHSMKQYTYVAIRKDTNENTMLRFR